MSEYARLTCHPELPPLWAFGYQQSHRTLASHEDVLAEAKTFREKRLPCDTLMYLGTGFCPSGWNTENGSFSWNKRVFPDPKVAIAQLRQEHFRVVLHSVILENDLRGRVHDPCHVARFDKEQVSCAWDAHRETFALGVDGWWPDEGDPLGIEARLARNRMYWEGPQLDRPNERPYALHRNGYAGMQRYASFLWSGDVYSTWETLKTHVPVAINTSLTGIPYWGTDIGGFVPTKEFTAELYLRWFQFGAFCTLFRCHGRAWKLRLPWGWNTGEIGPTEIGGYNGSALPDPSELHNAQVEPICRKYLELRYRLLPYLYSAVREATLTGMPVMRSLWLHYPDDPQAVQRGDEHLWGRDILVARSSGKVLLLAACIFRGVAGTIFGPTNVSTVAAKSIVPWTSKHFHSLFAKARLFLSVRSNNMWMKRLRACSPSPFIPEPTASSSCTKTTAFPSTTARVIGWDFRSNGMKRDAR
jgi:alpha-glucosidase (family GH31 glycosyl hydrolase)